MTSYSDCPSLGELMNGRIVTTEVLSTGVEAIYECNKGYDIIGNVTRICLEDGTWSGAAPVCKIKGFSYYISSQHFFFSR